VQTIPKVEAARVANIVDDPKPGPSHVKPTDESNSAMIAAANCVWTCLAPEMATK
jgi:hypothetical protein